MDRLEEIAETYAWYQSVGNQVEDDSLARYVHNFERSDIWVANHVSRVRARSQSDVDHVLREVDRVLAHCRHRMFIVDPFTPDPFIARLVLEGFTELTPTLQMVLEGPLAASGGRPARSSSGSTQVELEPVISDADWQALYPLARANHIEGSSSHHLQLEEETTRHLILGYRAKSAISQFFLARWDGVACAYGSAVIGPHGMGIIEDLFTLQAYRLRGIAAAIIAHAVEYARNRGMGPILIGPHVTETPKSFYAALGFVPQCVTRQYFRDSDGTSAPRSASSSR